MPPAFNLSQDQTLQFNPSVCQFLTKPASHSKQSPKIKKLLRVSTSLLSKLLHRTGVSLTPLTGQNQPGDNPLPVPVQRLKKTRSTHTHRLFRLLKSDADFPAAVSGEGRIIRIEIRGSTLFGVFHSQNSLFGHGEREIALKSPYEISTRANLRLPTWITKGPPTGNLRPLSLTFSPSSLTPPCSIMRSASEVLAVRPACLMTW